MNRIRMIGETLLPSVAYGDAAGLPTETMSASDVKKRYDYIDRLIPPTDNPFYPGSFPAGTTSDDTQLSVAVAEALMADDGFDLDGQAAEHLRIFHNTPRTKSGRVRGWGGSTTSSMERLETGISPHESGQPNGAGNGILMKMAPLVYWQVARGIDYDGRTRQYDELTTMTHDSDVTRACTRVHGDILSEIMTKPGMTMDDFRFTALGILQEDLDADPRGRIERALRYPTRSFDQLVTRYATGQKTGTMVSSCQTRWLWPMTSLSWLTVIMKKPFI